MNSSNTITADLGLRLIAPEQMIVPLAASFLYSADDPYAVRIAFRAGLDEPPVEWIFGRDLLSTGIEDCAGLGDVRVWATAGSEGGAPGRVVHIELSSPSGQAHLEAPAGEISDFLQRTYQFVPAGQEGGHVDVEAELDGLLRRAS
jgi:Streptomyces sporulation and cell division protein, SsgA